VVVRKEALIAIATVILVAFAVAGCSGSVHIGSSNSLSKDDVAKQAQTQLNKKYTAKGLPPIPAVTCDSDLQLKVGSSTKCESTGDFGKQQGTLDITATVTSVHGSTGDVHYNATGFKAQK
jgi:Domain of unknown function (DUF4333)